MIGQEIFTIPTGEDALDKFKREMNGRLKKDKKRTPIPEQRA